MKPGLASLYTNRLIILFAGGLVGLFLPIFLYEQFGNDPSVLLMYYFLVFTSSFFLMAPGAMLMSKIGLRTSMILAVIVLSGWYISFAFFDPSYAMLFLLIALVLHNLWRMLYWTPFHTEFAEMTEKGRRGRALGLLHGIASLLSIVTPIVAGWVILQFGYDALFLVVAAIILSSIFPLFFTPQVSEKYSFGYFETFKKLFDKEHRRMVTAYVADGAEGLVGHLIWPIFIFEILDGNYFEVGALSGAIILVGVIIRLFTGNYVDKHSRHKTLKIGTTIYAIGWFFKMFVDTAFQIFIASTFHNFAMIIMRTPFDVLMYERAADAGHYVDEYTVIREMSICLGRAVMIALVFGALMFLPLYWVFVLAAIATLFMNKID